MAQCASGEYHDGKAVRCPNEATTTVSLPDIERSVEVCEEHAGHLAHPVGSERGGEVCPTCKGQTRVINAFDQTEIDCPACVEPDPVCEVCDSPLDAEGRCEFCWERGL